MTTNTVQQVDSAGSMQIRWREKGEFFSLLEVSRDREPSDFWLLKARVDEAGPWSGFKTDGESLQFVGSPAYFWEAMMAARTVAMQGGGYKAVCHLEDECLRALVMLSDGESRRACRALLAAIETACASS